MRDLQKGTDECAHGFDSRDALNDVSSVYTRVHITGAYNATL